MTAAWIVNQAIGVGALGCPLDANTVLWGFAIGAAALLSTTASKLVLRSLPRARNPATMCSCGLFHSSGYVDRVAVDADRALRER